MTDTSLALLERQETDAACRRLCRRWRFYTDLGLHAEAMHVYIELHTLQDGY